MMIILAGIIIPPLLVPAFSMAATINPESSDLSVKVGEAATATITVTNDRADKASYHIDFLLAKFGKSADDLSLVPLDPGVVAGISASPSVFTLAAGESRNVSVAVTLPLDHSGLLPVIAVLVIEDAPVGMRGGVQTALTSLLFLHTADLIARNVQNVQIENFSAIPGFTFGRSVVLTELAKNTGADTVMMPRDVRVFNVFGAEVDRFFLASEEKRLPPGTQRSISTKWPQSNDIFQSFVLGPYRFELWDADQRLAVTRSWFLPTQVIGGVIVIFGAVALGIIIFVRRRA